MASTIPKPSIEYSRVRNIIRNDYYSYLDGSTNMEIMQQWAEAF